MENHKPRTKEYLLLRDCLLIHLHRDKGIGLQEIADEVGLSKTSVISRLRLYEDPAAAAIIFD